MQQKIDDNVHLGQTVSLFHSIGKSTAIDRTASDFYNAIEKVLKNHKTDIYWRI